jgi:hypothetical protein
MGIFSMASGRRIPDPSAMVWRTIPAQTSARRNHRLVADLIIQGTLLIAIGFELRVNLNLLD